MSITPTNYDLQQDSRIDEIQEIITTDYQEPDQTEYSYPVVDQPMSDEQWQYVTLGIGNGVLDEGGRPYWLQLNESEANTNSTNTMKLAVSVYTDTAQAIFQGFYHRLLKDMVLHFPGVTSTTTYYVVLQYDPTGHQEARGPLRVEVVTSLDTTMGKSQLILWMVTRKPNQLLTEATITRVRPRVAPPIYVWEESHKPDANKQLSGALCIVGETASIYRVSSDDVGGQENREWVHLSNTYIRGDASYIWAGTGARPGSTRAGNMVILEGRVARSSGAMFEAGRGHTVMTLPERHRPPVERRFVTKGPGTEDATRMATIVVSSNGDVTAYANYDMSWVGLDGCIFTIRS